MTEIRENREEESLSRPGFLEIAREEFWIVAKSYFAPIYGTMLVWRRLLRLTRQLDRRALSRKVPPSSEEPWLSPAE